MSAIAPQPTTLPGATNLPRYTSYPTADHFSTAIGAAEHGAWLAALPADTRLSLYLHIPFCREICFYCGCTTQAVRRRFVLDAYLAALEAEIGRVGALLPSGPMVTALHLGGGSPDILDPEDITSLMATLSRAFSFAPRLEFAIEIDPRGFSPAKADALAASGLTRASIGVQDFAQPVQNAIGRHQTVAVTAEAVRLLRTRGVGSISIDLVYGLPHQTEESLAATLAEILALAPDRIAAFGYAHLPQRNKRQGRIDARTLPDAASREAGRALISRILTEAGYRSCGIDHFAKPSDPLARMTLHRNFQGYTTDDADALIGLGASAISRLPQGYTQNAPRADSYAAALADRRLATQRGCTLSDEDRVRADAIEQILCGMRFSAPSLAARHGSQADTALSIAAALPGDAPPGLVRRTADGFAVTEAGRAQARLIAARFDAYLSAPPPFMAMAGTEISCPD